MLNIRTFVLFMAGVLSLTGAETNKSLPQKKSAPKVVQAKPADADDQAIDRVMARFEKASLSGEVDYFIEVMYAPLLEHMGGKERATASARTAQAEVKAEGISYASWKTRKPYQYVTGKSRRYVVIGYQATLTKKGDSRKLRLEGYLLGIKEGKSGWQFVNGDSLTPEYFAQFFPDFPKTVTLPAVKKAFE